jgi:small subunit ribosomal protein S8e
MALIRTRGKTKRSGSGARYIAYRKTKLYELAIRSTMTKLGETKKKISRTRAGEAKQRLLDVNKVNLFNPKTKKYEVVAIETVVENPANSQLVRRNIITRGSIVQTAKGRARITSRPGQTGFLNAVLVQ